MNSFQLLKTAALPNFFKHDVQEPVPDKSPARASVLHTCLDALFVDDSQRHLCNRKYSFIEEACWPVD